MKLQLLAGFHSCLVGQLEKIWKELELKLSNYAPLFGKIMDHQMRCKNCNREWTTNLDTNGSYLKYCPGCSGGFWELSIKEEDYAISGETVMGRFSPLLFLRSLHHFVRGCLLIAGTISGITIVLIGAGLGWLSDLIFKERR